MGILYLWFHSLSMTVTISYYWDPPSGRSRVTNPTFSFTWETSRKIYAIPIIWHICGCWHWSFVSVSKCRMEIFYLATWRLWMAFISSWWWELWCRWICVTSLLSFSGWKILRNTFIIPLLMTYAYCSC